MPVYLSKFKNVEVRNWNRNPLIVSKNCEIELWGGGGGGIVFFYFCGALEIQYGLLPPFGATPVLFRFTPGLISAVFLPSLSEVRRDASVGTATVLYLPRFTLLKCIIIKKKNSTDNDTSLAQTATLDPNKLN